MAHRRKKDKKKMSTYQTGPAKIFSSRVTKNLSVIENKENIYFIPLCLYAMQIKRNFMVQMLIKQFKY